MQVGNPKGTQTPLSWSYKGCLHYSWGFLSTSENSTLWNEKEALKKKLMMMGICSLILSGIRSSEHV